MIFSRHFRPYCLGPCKKIDRTHITLLDYSIPGHTTDAYWFLGHGYLYPTYLVGIKCHFIGALARRNNSILHITQRIAPHNGKLKSLLNQTSLKRKTIAMTHYNYVMRRKRRQFALRTFATAFKFFRA